MKVLRQTIWLSIVSWWLLATPLLASMDSNSTPGVSLKVERVGGMTHFEFHGDRDWKYRLESRKGQIELEIPKLNSEAIEQLENFSSLLVEKISIDNEHPNKAKLVLHLGDPRVQSFDYLTQEPNSLVVDLYVENDKILSELRAAQKAGQVVEVAKPQKTQTSTRANPSKAGRKPAFSEYFVVDGQKSQEGGPAKDEGELLLSPMYSAAELFNLGNLSSSSYNQEDLEAKVMEAQGNIYLRFPILRLENKHLRELQSFHPEYEIRPSFSDENKQARFLLKLFNQRSFASFIKAKKIFKDSFPESKYDEILNYVEADTWVELWKMNKRPEYLSKAMNIYRMLIERYPDSKIAERTLINAGLLAHDVGEYFIATKMLRRYLKNYAYSPFNNHIKIYLADSLAHLNNYDGAKVAYDQVIEADEKDTVVEANFRLGDVYFLKQSFRRAERSYQDAIEKYPRYVEQYPNALFNKAEAQFNLAEYPTSLQSYRDFFEKFPQHPYSAYALTRIGELIDLLEGDKKKAQGFYNESFFRYRKTVGGTIARMRSLSQRFKFMKEEELKVAIEEIKDREKMVDLHQVDEFAAFMISDGYYGRGDFLNAANTLINYFQINPKPINIKKFEKRISRAIAGEVREMLQSGNLVGALDIIQSHQKSWRSKSRRVDVQYFRAKAYEKMKLYDEALDSYRRLAMRMQGLIGTKEEKERKVFEYYPSSDEIRLRQAVAYYEKGEKKEALALLTSIKDISGLTEESKTDFHFTLSRLSFDAKKYSESLKTIQLVDSDSIVDPDIRERYSVFLSKVYEKNKMFDQSISILEDFYKKYKSEQDQVYVLSRLFHLYKSKGLKEKAISVGETLLTDYSNKYNLDKERYYLGEMLFEQDKTQKANDIWKNLTKKSMWSELARNKQISGQWKNTTEDKIKRIPAMTK
jgi:tetratricopeptide (TPR) repeat protein